MAEQLAFSESRAESIDGGGPKMLVVEEDLLVAQAFVSALTQRGFIARFAIPVTAAHIDDAARWAPELALVGVANAHDSDGLSLVDLLHRHKVKVCVLSGCADELLLAQCIKGGANAIVDRHLTLDELEGVLRRLLAGEPGLVTCGTSRHQRRLPYGQMARAHQERVARLAPFASLTARERIVLGQLMEGATARAIADDRWVSLSTVRSQIKSIFQKLGVNSQLAAVALAREAGWSADERAKQTSFVGDRAAGQGAETKLAL